VLPPLSSSNNRVESDSYPPAAAFNELEIGSDATRLWPPGTVKNMDFLLGFGDFPPGKTTELVVDSIEMLSAETTVSWLVEQDRLRKILCSSPICCFSGTPSDFPETYGFSSIDDEADVVGSES
jgi:hypothetical protein